MLIIFEKKILCVLFAALFTSIHCFSPIDCRLLWVYSLVCSLARSISLSPSRYIYFSVTIFQHTLCANNKCAQFQNCYGARRSIDISAERTSLIQYTWFVWSVWVCFFLPFFFLQCTFFAVVVLFFLIIFHPWVTTPVMTVNIFKIEKKNHIWNYHQKSMHHCLLLIVRVCKRMESTEFEGKNDIKVIHCMHYMMVMMTHSTNIIDESLFLKCCI